MGTSRAILFGIALAFGLTGGIFPPVPAQAQSLGRVQSPVLTVDRDRLFSGTLYGQRINSELEAASDAMAQETRRIEAALEEEEKSLTAQRGILEPEAFRALADAFDEKVQALRQERDTAEANLRSQIEEAQLAFFDQIGPVLGQIVRERGAVLILDRRAILLAAADVDITDAAIARIDATLGDGAEAAPDEAAPADETDAPVDTIPAPDAVEPTE